MRKQILVYYINVGNLVPSDVDSYIESIKKKIKISERLAKENGIVEQVFVPLKVGETKIESINLS